MDSESSFLLSEWREDEPYFKFGDKHKRTRPAQGRPWRVAPENKRLSVHKEPSTSNALLNVYPHAIEIGSPMGSEGGRIFGFIGMAASLGMSSFAVYFSFLMFKGGYLFTSLIFSAVAIAAIVGLIFFGNATLFSPRDLPILLNRKNRTVSFFDYKQPHVLKFWSAWGAGEVKTYSWDSLRARAYKWTVFTGSAARESYHLNFLFDDPSNPHLCQEIVTAGPAGWWEDGSLWQLYEHIRRYMEDDGPPIQAGESLRRGGLGKLPTFPPEVIAAAGGAPLSYEDAAKLAGHTSA
ncbi:DUF6708 domain-containing protein [Xanthomonas oryzae]|uniref:DUF6708 domain-containing protein n=1 Tax=Xanthomonas oryzae TaxID=347 RepID=UPI001F4CBCCB|nr:DUF6708 domain-containing protein [Xanthomonas oryzae]UNE64547.1 hypothetical protein MML47_10965 [Xanthomonas oryzae]